ncbi:MAG: SGNH/GDSL hydrolase family protein [Pseudomarimonas sp.]
MTLLRALFFVTLTSLSTHATTAELRYLALGDSYTIGEGVAESARWPVVLAQQLRADGIALSTPRIIAQTGWTTDELSAAMDAAAPLGEWDFVSLLIGVNNQYRGRSVEEFRREFSALLTRAIQLARGRSDRVLVLAIPDWGVTPFAEGRDRSKIAAELDDYNAAKRAVCASKGVAFVDISALSRKFGGQPTHLAADGLHPGPALYLEWARAARAAARERLSP